MEQRYTTAEVQVICGTKNATTTRWAKNNGVQKIVMPSGAAGFIWTKGDLESFKNRQKPGRPFVKKEKQ